MKGLIAALLFGLTLGGTLLLGAILIPWNETKWGQITTNFPSTITVSGQAETQISNQIARFSAGVSAVNDDKNAATNDVNQKITAITSALKTFGIAGEDIQTQYLNVYQNQETYYEDGRQKSRLGQWSVNNTIDIKLRDINRASDLVGILSTNGATNINGPSFSVDDTKAVDVDLLSQALLDAREKAAKMLAKESKTLGEVVSITEAGIAVPNFYPAALKDGAGGGGGAPISAGSATVSKSVTVTFKIQ